MIPNPVVHLLSGGLDSVIALYWLKQEGHPVHCAVIDYKQRHAQETQWAIHHARRMDCLWTTFDLPQLRGSELTDGSGGVVVPARNAIFLSMAANLAVSIGTDTLTFAANKDDESVFPDCRMAFVQTFNNMLTTANIPVQVWAPFLDKSKAWIVSLGRELGVSFNETWSCYRGGIQPCGECLACRKRQEALATLEVNA